MKRTDTDFWPTLRAVLRGLTAVAGLFLSAVDELVTAWLGCPRIAATTSRYGHLIADTYRLGYMGAVEGDVIDEGGR